MSTTTDEALDAIAQWASSSDPVVFRHLRVNHGDFTHPGVRQSIWKSVTKHKDHVIFVGSKMEADVAKDGTWDLNSESPPTFATYLEFVELLEKNRTRNGKGHEAWKEEWQPDGRIQKSILPSRLLIIMSIEPQMPCECAIALVAAVHLAMDISQRKEAGIRVLTMSPGEEAPALGRLLELYSVPRATQVDMSGTSPTGFQTVCADPSEVSRHVLYNLTPDPAEKDIIMCFPSFNRTFPLGAHFQRLDDSGVLDKAWIEAESSRWPRSELIFANLQWEEGTPGHLVYASNGFRAPCGIAGFDRVHIVLGSTDVTPVFDAVTGQITLTELALSRDERLEQVSWIGRADCLPENIFVYIDTRHCTVEEFVEAGHGYRRLKVSNRQLGGFLGSLAGMSHWGLDFYQIAEQFVTEHVALREMTSRMLRQEIITQPSVSRCDDITLGMPDDERIIFKTVLPLLDYDHRLAYFLARRSSSGLVRQVKIQVAALMCVGPHEVVQLFNPDEKTSAENLADLVNACWGCTRRMAKTGTIWLMSSLWKRVVNSSSSGGDLEPSVCRKSHSHLPIPDTFSSVDSQRLFELKDLIAALNTALGILGVPNQYLDMTQGIDEKDLTKPQELELQVDLLHAYLFQLVVSTKHRHDGAEVFMTHDISTAKWFGTIVVWFRLMIDAAWQTDGNPEAVYGVYHLLRRRGQHVDLQEWTWIPIQLVSDWHFAKAGEETIHSYLASNPLPTRNFDDV
ncbi:hypothetical protein AUP68_02606 [Ilyonectria robusta]